MATLLILFQIWWWFDKVFCNWFKLNCWIVIELKLKEIYQKKADVTYWEEVEGFIKQYGKKSEEESKNLLWQMLQRSSRSGWICWLRSVWQMVSLSLFRPWWRNFWIFMQNWFWTRILLMWKMPWLLQRQHQTCRLDRQPIGPTWVHEKRVNLHQKASGR